MFSNFINGFKEGGNPKTHPRIDDPRDYALSVYVVCDITGILVSLTMLLCSCKKSGPLL